MHKPIQITFRGMEPSDAIERAVRAKARKLERFGDIVSCHVIVQEPHRHGHKGRLYAVRVDVHVADCEIVAGKERHEHHAHEDVYVALRDAFNAAQRQLERLGRKRLARRHDPSLQPS